MYSHPTPASLFVWRVTWSEWSPAVCRSSRTPNCMFGRSSGEVREGRNALQGTGQEYIVIPRSPWPHRLIQGFCHNLLAFYVLYFCSHQNIPSQSTNQSREGFPVFEPCSQGSFLCKGKSVRNEVKEILWEKKNKKIDSKFFIVCRGTYLF